MSNAETFLGESGLLTGYEGTVIEAWFGVDTKFGGTRLYLKQSTNVAAHPEWTENFSVGGAWQSLDGGLTVDNTEDATKKKFHQNSRVQKFINRCFELGMGELLASRGVAQDSRIWLGCSFAWDEVQEPYTMTDPDTKQKVSGVSRYNMPSAFLGAGTSASSPGAASSGSVLDTLDSGLVEQLREARAKATTHGDFVDATVGLTGVSGNGKLIAAIADEDQLYKELA